MDLKSIGDRKRHAQFFLFRQRGKHIAHFPDRQRKIKILFFRRECPHIGLCHIQQRSDQRQQMPRSCQDPAGITAEFFRRQMLRTGFNEFGKTDDRIQRGA